MSISRKKPKGATRKTPKRSKIVVPTMIDWRPNAVLIGLGVAFVALIARSFYLQVIDSERLKQFGNRHVIEGVNISAHRGPILDRNGRPLAVSTPVDSIWVDPQEVASDIDRIGELAKALDMDQTGLLARISRNPSKRFLYLRRGLTPERARAVMSLNMKGVKKQREYRRFYTAPVEAGHVIGFTDIDDRGQEGLELAFDSWMRGTPGRKRMMRDLHGHRVEDVELVKPADPGKELELSIDLDIQYLAYRELKKVVKREGARSGSLVVLDVRTGEILAMVNQPSYNPNDRSQFVASRYRNRCVTDIAEPGSAMKPFIVAAALESGRYDATSIVDTSPGRFMVAKKKIEDRRNHGPLSLGGILKVSSNVGISKVALELPSEQIWRTLTNLGFGRLTNSGFPGESAGLLTSYQHWRDIGKATMAYGYGLSVTSLQLAHAYATIGNGGVRTPITFLKLDKEVTGERVLSQNTTENLLNMLVSVTDLDGTGSKARIPGYSVAGKTGTARKYSASGYDEDRHIATFAGVAPASNPELAVVVVVDEPGGERYYGGQIAAPVFAKVMGEALRKRGVAPDVPASMSANEAVDRAIEPGFAEAGDDS
ncbi:MAG: peptidoglycan D,D-transpeptidase FtsI family protein [Gammaproteobacteria bacterium]